MRIQDKSGFVCVLLAILALLLQAGYYLGGFAYTHPEYFFVIVAVIGTATLYSIFAHPSRKFLVCFMILCTATFMNLTYVYYSQGFSYIPPLDAIYHWKTAEAITTSGRINLVENATHIEFEYSSYPGFHLFISIATQITGIDSIVFVKLIPLVYAILPFLVFIIVKKIFPSNEVTAGLAAYITIFLPKWYAFPSYNRFVIIYLLMLFFFMIELTIAKNRAHFALALLTIGALSITHHIITYITVFFIIFTIIFTVFVKRLNLSGLPIFRNASQNTISLRALTSLLVCGLMFPVLSSPVSFEYHLRSLIRYFSPTYLPEEFSRNIMGSYTRIEQTFILAAIGMVCLVGFYGFIRYLRRDKWVVTTAAITVFFASVFTLSLPTLYLNSVVYSYVAGRLTFILFIVISPFVGAALTVFHHSTRAHHIGTLVAVFLLLSLTFASVDLIPHGLIYFSEEQSTSHLWEVRDNHDSLYSSLLWIRKNTVTSAWTGVGDVPLASLGHGMLNLDLQHYWPLFEEPLNGSEHLNQLTKMGVEYVFVNTLLTMYREQPEERIFIGPIPAANLEMAIEQTWLSRIYDNSVIIVMRINEAEPVS